MIRSPYHPARSVSLCRLSWQQENLDDLKSRRSFKERLFQEKTPSGLQTTATFLVQPLRLNVHKYGMRHTENYSHVRGAQTIAHLWQAAVQMTVQT